MALLTTYTSANRVIEEDLHTTFRRENILIGQSDVGAAYLKYTRIRTKRYKYVGLTHEAAINCANAKDLLFQRKIYNWVWDSQNHIWKINQEASNNKYVFQSCGRATPQHVGGDCWEVNIEVDEEITIPWRDMAQIPSTQSPFPLDWLPYPFTDFESQPSVKTNYFMGVLLQPGGKVDFDYDEN